MIKLWQHGPYEVWSYEQSITGDVIQSAVWSIHPAGPVLDSQANASTSTQIRVGGLTRGTRYDLMVHITTAGGEQLDRVAKLLCT